MRKFYKNYIKNRYIAYQVSDCYPLRVTKITRNEQSLDFVSDSVIRVGWKQANFAYTLEITKGEDGKTPKLWIYRSRLGGDPYDYQLLSCTLILPDQEKLIYKGYRGRLLFDWDGMVPEVVKFYGA